MKTRLLEREQGDINMTLKNNKTIIDFKNKNLIENSSTNDYNNFETESFNYIPFNNIEFNNLTSSDNKYTDTFQDANNILIDHKNDEPIFTRNSNCIKNINDFQRNKQLKIQVTKVIDLNQNIVNIIENKDYPNYNILNSPCFWCRHVFTNSPIPLPKYYINEIFYVYDFIFCSFNCAEAHRRDHPNKESETGLLLLLYATITNDTSQLFIKPSPDPRLLKLYGGPLSIEDFREKHLSFKEYKIINPPLIALVQQMEETYTVKQVESINKKDNSDSNSDSNDNKVELFKNPNIYGIPPEKITENSFKKVTKTSETNELKLKRTKPLPKSLERNLETFLNKSKK